MTKPQLVLDVGGVLLTNMTDFWREAAACASVPGEQLRAQFRKDLRRSLWSGELPESGFWSWLTGRFPALDAEETARMLQKSLQPLPAMALIPQWSEMAGIHLLSNHRAEWIRPLLEPILPFIAGVTISSESGVCKPEEEIYRLAASQLTGQGPVLYIDDQDVNFVQAEKLGWRTLTADEAGEWTKQVERLLA
ncbi:hypothetical protein [Paenibacillus humicola]|uniref:hypothetical protein n=1 Tax=Paenibacillus humicola TaxID=3110540 RepID=UPI00237A3046|nr:hypothetical protein [Paenibacillus humicola]